MSQCGSHDCYPELSEYYESYMSDLYDFDIQLTNFFPDDGIWLSALFGLLLFYVILNYQHRSTYLEAFEINKNEDSSYCEYNRIFWPYFSTQKVPHDLEDRMKYWEKCSQQITKVEPEYPFIVRIDGCSFSSFTHQLKKFSNDEVFSDEFSDAMLSTACDLLLKFRATTVYTHSDEITLVFRNYVDFDDDYNEIITGDHYRKGKVYKLLSEIPSFASVAFMRNIVKCYRNNIDALEYLSHCDIAFDARLIVFPIEATYEVGNHMVWRTRDCYRNYVSAYAEKYIGKKKLDKVSTEARVNLLKDKGIDLEDETNLTSKQLGRKYGTFLKLFNSNKHVNSIQAFYSNKLSFSDELVDFMLWPLKELEYDDDSDNSDEPQENSSDDEHPVILSTTDSTKNFSIDSYEFEDIFDGTFTLENKKNRTQ